MAAVDLDTVRAAARRLGLSGAAVCVHASLRSFGRVEGGPAALLGGLIDEGCTVLVPTFTDYLVPPPLDSRPSRNGWNYDEPPVEFGTGDRTYSVDDNAVAKRMGAVPAAVLAHPERRRGYHPLASFAAVGPCAEELVAGQRPLDALAPLRALVELDGFVLLMGVGLERATILHLAEQRGGRRPFRRWARDASGAVIDVDVGGCSRGFPALEPAVSPLERITMIGDSRWRAFPAGAMVETAAATIAGGPAITHCGDPGCARCDDAILGGPLEQQRDRIPAP